RFARPGADCLTRAAPSFGRKFDSPSRPVYDRRVETQTQSAPVTLRGTGRGLEIFIDEGPPLYEVIAQLEARLSHSPGFFAGAEVTIWLGGRTLPPGGLAHLKAVTDRYEIKIAALRAERQEIQQAASNLQIPVTLPSVVGTERTPLQTPLP